MANHQEGLLVHRQHLPGAVKYPKHTMRITRQVIQMIQMIQMRHYGHIMEQSEQSETIGKPGLHVTPWRFASPPPLSPPPEQRRKYHKTLKKLKQSHRVSPFRAESIWKWWDWTCKEKLSLSIWFLLQDKGSPCCLIVLIVTVAWCWESCFFQVEHLFLFCSALATLTIFQNFSEVLLSEMVHVSKTVLHICV